MHIKWLLHRDYFLETIDHITGLSALSGYYPRLGFGPGQRYLAKGCFILGLGAGAAEPTLESAAWITIGG